MKRGLIYIFILMVFSLQAAAMEVLHNLETTIGVFDACTETFSYKFTDNNYDIKTRYGYKRRISSLRIL